MIKSKNPSHMVRNLSTLVDLRSNEVTRLQTEMAAKESVRERYQKNLERLTGLYQNLSLIHI